MELADRGEAMLQAFDIELRRDRLDILRAPAPRGSGTSPRARTRNCRPPARPARRGPPWRAGRRGNGDPTFRAEQSPKYAARRRESTHRPGRSRHRGRRRSPRPARSSHPREQPRRDKTSVRRVSKQRGRPCEAWWSLIADRGGSASLGCADRSDDGSRQAVDMPRSCLRPEPSVKDALRNHSGGRAPSLQPTSRPLPEHKRRSSLVGVRASSVLADDSSGPHSLLSRGRGWACFSRRPAPPATHSASIGAIRRRLERIARLHAPSSPPGASRHAAQSLPERRRRSRWIRCADGVAIRTARWPALTPRPLGTICLFHGRSEFIEKYFEIVRDLRARGFAVATFDWRGQGGSDRLIEDPAPRPYRGFRPLCPRPRRLHAPCRPAGMPGAVLRPRPFDGLGRPVRQPAGPQRLVRAHRRDGADDRLAAQAALGPGASPRRLSSIGLSHRIVPGWSPPGGLEALRRQSRHLGPAALRHGGGALPAEPAPRHRRADDRLGAARPSPDGPAPARRSSAPNGARRRSSSWQERTASCRRRGAGLRRDAAGHRAVTLPGALHEVMQERDDLRDRFLAAFDAFVPGSAGLAMAG